MEGEGEIGYGGVVEGGGGEGEEMREAGRWGAVGRRHGLLGV